MTTRDKPGPKLVTLQSYLSCVGCPKLHVEHGYVDHEDGSDSVYTNYCGAMGGKEIGTTFAIKTPSWCPGEKP